MSDLPTGRILVNGCVIENMPKVGLKDCLRKFRDGEAAGLDIQDPKGMSARLVESVAREEFRLATDRPQNSGHGFEIWTHRQAADVARLMVIHWLEITHKPPHERIPYESVLAREDDEGGEPARSRLFREVEIHTVQGIDTTARIVGGTDPE